MSEALKLAFQQIQPGVPTYICTNVDGYELNVNNKVWSVSFKNKVVQGDITGFANAKAAAQTHYENNNKSKGASTTVATIKKPAGAKPAATPAAAPAAKPAGKAGATAAKPAAATPAAKPGAKAAAPAKPAPAPKPEKVAKEPKPVKETTPRTPPRVSPLELAEAALVNAQGSLHYAEVFQRLHYLSPIAQTKLENAQARVKDAEAKVAELKADTAPAAPAAKGTAKK